MIIWPQSRQVRGVAWIGLKSALEPLAGLELIPNRYYCFRTRPFVVLDFPQGEPEECMPCPACKPSLPIPKQMKSTMLLSTVPGMYIDSYPMTLNVNSTSLPLYLWSYNKNTVRPVCRERPPFRSDVPINIEAHDLCHDHEPLLPPRRSSQGLCRPLPIPSLLRRSLPEIPL